MRHTPVLLHEVIESLQLKPGMNVVDCTLGDGGHTEAILERTAPNGRVIGIDADPESIVRAKTYLYRFDERVVYVRDHFVHLATIVRSAGIQPIHGILMDLGWSRPQFEERGRGFSFEKNEPLDMRYDGESQKSKETAADILNQRSGGELERIFHEYGEESLSREIAGAIITARQKEPIQRTTQLVDIILATYQKKLKSKKTIPWVGGLHPATKVFQALRIVVNQELEQLQQTLPQAIDILAPGGRLAVITFHSLEDRMVKHYLKSQNEKRIRIITKKPIVCVATEWAINPSARSAKLRVAEKL